MIQHPTVDLIGGRALVEIAEEQASRIVHTARPARPDRGVVVAIGPGETDPKGRLRRPDVGLGVEVVFAHSAGIDYQFEGRAFRLLRAVDPGSEILASIERMTV